MEHIDTLEEILSMAMKAVCVSFCLSYPNILPDHVWLPESQSLNAGKGSPQEPWHREKVARCQL
jgi:hypothetical protein